MSTSTSYTFAIGYHFTATGAPADQEACGTKDDLPTVLKTGTHGSALTVDFRSNRVKSSTGFFLALTCTITARMNDDAGAAGASSNVQLSSSCTPSVSLDNKVVRDPHVHMEASVEEYFVSLYTRKFMSSLKSMHY